MKQIESKQHRPKRITFRTFAAAAIVLSLLVTAMAVGASDWFRSYFAENGELSPGQLQYIDENAVLLEESRTSGAYTVTLESYISDGVQTLLKLRIPAELPAEALLHDVELRMGDAEPDSYSYVWSSAEGQDNTVILCIGDSDDGEVLNRGRVTLIFRGPEDTEFVFDLDIRDTTFLELITEPISGVTAKTELGEDFTITIESARLRAMDGLTCRYSFDDPVFAFTHHQHGAVKAAMTDGGEILMIPSTWWHTDGNEYFVTFTPLAPLNLDEVTELILPVNIHLPIR